ncbi:MAG: MATE family efflux transporter [Proteobacteria bacterium]|nr:MATE family efflux transporter [Pseudomonadota bacterium]MDE0911921.1 MATE family efflux transporter [Myxococcota bacterium]
MIHSSDPEQKPIRDDHPRTSSVERGGVREVLILAIPVVLTHISITGMQIVDSVMVGQLGSPQLASVGFGGVWLWTLVCLFVGTTTCVQTFVSQHFGSGNHTACGAWAWQGLYAIVPVSLLLGVGLFAGSGALITWLEPDASITPFAIDYLTTRGYGVPGLVAAVTLSSFFRGFGDTRTPLYATVFANLVNVVLDYGLIFGKLGLPELGVAGAGIATSIAEWTNFFVLFFFFRSKALMRAFGTQFIGPNREQMRRLLRTGLPVGAQWWLEMASFAIFLTLVARMGDAPMAASQAFISLLSISFMQAQGLGIAVTTLVGQYIGARDFDAAERSFYSGIRLCLIIAGVVGAMLVLIPEPLLGLYSDDPRVLALARPLMMVGAVFQIFDALAIIADGGLRGAGDTRWPMIARFLLSWCLFLPAAYFLGVVLEGGLTWAWGGGVIYIVALTWILLARFRSGRWKYITI